MQLWEKEQIQTLLPAIGVMLILAVILRLALGNKEERIRRIPLQIITVILLILEVCKQVASFMKGYNLYHIPLHYCSLFLYAMPPMAFYNGKHRQKVTAIGTGICAALTLMMLIYPGIIYSGSNVRNYFTDIFSFHTVTFHNLAMFAFPVIIALQLHAPQKGDGKAILLFTLGFAITAGIMAQVLKTNFANFYSCNVPFLDAIRVNWQTIMGKGLSQFIYATIVGIAHIAFTVMSYQLYRALNKLFSKKIPNAEPV